MLQRLVSGAGRAAWRSGASALQLQGSSSPSPPSSSAWPLLSSSLTPGGLTRPMSSQNDPPQGQNNRHPCFPRLSDTPVQGRFEAAEVEKAYEGLFVAPWFTLWDSPTQPLVTLITRPLARLKAFLLQPIYSRVSTIAAAMVENEVEGSFDRQEFLDGASDAMHAVVDRFGSQDWPGLRNVCSERLVERFKIALTELEHAHDVRLASLHVTDLQGVTPPRLGSVNLWTSDNIARFDETWAKEASESTSSSWLVATVTVHASLLVVYKSAKTGTLLPPKVLLRHGSWIFARGPLPKGFSSSLNLPWRVLGLW